jgi:hypothetical protein
MSTLIFNLGKRMSMVHLKRFLTKHSQAQRFLLANAPMLITDFNAVQSVLLNEKSYGIIAAQ